jgi:16S rRNA (cytidine1402-2'-O)-methyltransferase
VTTGTLWLVPNTLDLGASEVDIREVLPAGVLRRAAGLAHWVAEDARTTRAFLKRVAAVVPLAQTLQATDIRELPRPQKGPKGAADSTGKEVWQALLKPALEGRDIGLISEAGLPAVADPGALLVAAAHTLGVPVRPLAGASSLLLALAASGLNGQSFAFVGYVPQEPAARLARIRELEATSRRWQQTQLIIETPYRNAALLAALLGALSEQTMLSVSWGLTLEQESTRSSTVALWREGAVAMPARCPAVFCLLAR